MNSTLELNDFASLSPLLILLGGALVILLVESFAKPASKKGIAFISIATFLIALYAAIVSPISENVLLTSWLKFDSLGRLFTIFFLITGLCTSLLSTSFFQRFHATPGEYHFLLLSAVFGLILIGYSADFLTLFLGIETLSISLYVLCGYMKKWKFSNEAAIKYFLMGALAAAFLLYGIALIYGAIGTTKFDALLKGYKSLSATSDQVLFISGIALVTLALCFEAAIIPFHLWAPDVYDGAPTPVTAFMAVGTKAGAFAAFTRVFLVALPNFNVNWNECIAILAYATLIYANYLALRQIQLRRFFAYSGISHAGFMLIPLVASSPESISALIFYLVVYAAATLGSFAVLAFLDQHSEGVMLHDLYGLFSRSPYLAGTFSLCLLTLGGIPPTIGFFAKFYLFKVAFETGYYGLVIVGLLMAILSAYYYLRIVAIMLSEKPADAKAPARTWPAAIVGLCAFAAIIYLSFYPAPLMHLLALS